MTTIAEDADLVTFINVFTVEPANQQQLIDVLAHATQTSVRAVPGFISAALHRSVDGTRVTMYAQWKSAEHYRRYQAMLADPVASPYVKQALSLATFEPRRYEVVKVVAAPSRTVAD